MAYRLTVPNKSPAAIDSSKTDDKPIARATGRWFFVRMALVMIATSIGGFLPAIIEPATRRAPLTLLAEAHGIAFFMWLFLSTNRPRGECGRDALYPIGARRINPAKTNFACSTFWQRRQQV